MKRPLLSLLLVSLAFAQWVPNEKLFLDIDTDFLTFLPGRNPAYLSTENTPCSYAFRYRYDHQGGEYRLPLRPSLKSYQNISARAFQEMENGMIFAGRFAYRYEQRKDKRWLHNAENHLPVPFYFADSSTGDFTLNGIDWNVIFAYPLSEHLRTGVNIFYNVDEQFKSVFPKPNVKRNSLRIVPGLAFSGAASRLGLKASFFQYKEDMETKKYSLEQGKTPTFMRIRGLDKPLMTYADANEERLQNILGWGISGNADLGGIVLLETAYEHAAAEITDGGAYPVPQGDWDLSRFCYRIDLQNRPGPRLRANLFFQHQEQYAEGFHPDLNARIYGYRYRRYKGGLTVPYRHSDRERWTGTLAFVSGEQKREDNFLGLLDYFPSSTLQLKMHYEYRHRTLRYGLEFEYANTETGEAILYNESTDWYYREITEKEIAYFRRDHRKLRATVKLLLPLGSRHLEFTASYTSVRPKNHTDDYHLAGTSLSWLF